MKYHVELIELRRNNGYLINRPFDDIDIKGRIVHVFERPNPDRILVLIEERELLAEAIEEALR